MAERALHQLETRHALAYNPAFDIKACRKLEDLRHQFTISEYSRLKQQLDTRIRHNLETTLGERFNAQISEVYYRLDNGQLVSQEHDEPFAEIVKRGVDWRKRFGNPADHERENAELQGFAKIQQILTQPHIIPEFKVINISPRGLQDSDYQLNFFDIYEVVDICQIRMTRYASKMTSEEFLEAAKNINPSFKSPQVLNDSFFLENPVETFRSLEEILEIFHPDINSMAKAQFQNLILKDCDPLITAYIVNPSEKTYNALLNLADRLIGISLSPKVGSDPLIRGLTPISPNGVDRLINQFGALPVRPVTTGCGLQHGFSPTINGQLLAIRSFSEGWSTTNYYPYSVAEFALFSQSENQDTSDFPCPRCGYTITYGAGIKKCPGCGQEATCD